MWQQTFEREVEEIYEAEEQAGALIAWWLLQRFGTTDIRQALGV